MIKINKFYWELYKNSPNGIATIKGFEDMITETSMKQIVDVVLKYDTELQYNSEVDENIDYFNRIFYQVAYCSQNLPFNHIDECRHNAEYLLDDMTFKFYRTKDPYRDVMSSIVPISIFLYQKNPEYFLPYFFLIRYRYLHQIIADYNIEVNEVNGKFKCRDRLFFYFDLCDALYEFRKANNLTPSELCAFLYDMERKSLDSDDEEHYTRYPRVWLLVGAKGYRECNAETMFWQGNSEIKKGDICVFYENGFTESGCSSSISGIWVAQSNGRIDPFFYYYEPVLIGSEHKLSNPIPFAVLSNDPRTQTLPHLGARLCGAGGSELSVDLYEKGILPIIKEYCPDFDISLLPQIYHPELPQNSVEDRGDMKPEKWVEEYRIKPLLRDMGFIEGKDYLQQVFLQLGRDKEEGERVQAGRTDFSLFPFGNRRKGEAKCADVLIEAKAPGEMSNPKDIEKTFWQAESYGSRQYAQLLVITDGDQFLLYPRTKDGIFRYSEPDIKLEQYKWEELSDTESESFRKFRSTLLKYKKHKYSLHSTQGS